MEQCQSDKGDAKSKEKGREILACANGGNERYRASR